jgi:hypothetical protein
MPRSHGLQARVGVSRNLNVRLTDAEHEGLSRLRGDRRTTVSAVVREAIHDHLLFRSGDVTSAFFSVFAALIEQLVPAGVHPILAGRWAGVAHGYVHAVPHMQLLVRHDEVPALQRFVAARGGAPASLPFSAGREPWCVHFLSDYGGVGCADLATTPFPCGRVALDVVTLEALLGLPQVLEDFVVEDLSLLRAGEFDLDDGERGMVAWDLAGRLTASAYYSDPLSREPHRFVDLRLLEPLDANLLSRPAAES